jgi:putative ubiquitin-RnfH superfamily antitoxin RatB of RatAB toxin-antitoxin module
MHFCKSKNVNCTVTKNNRGYFLRNKIIDPNTLKKKRNFEELTQKKDKPDLPVGLLKVINL